MASRGWADGNLIPRGIYGIRRNVGHMNLRLSHDTSAFSADGLHWYGLHWYWSRIGRQCYPDATNILLLCVCGGSNAANRHLFKYYLQHPNESIVLSIRVAYLLSHCSKCNPIERQFFAHVGRAYSGSLFDSLAGVVNLMRQTSTRTGLRTTVNVIRRVHETGQEIIDERKSRLNIIYGEALRRLSYATNP